MRSINQKIEVPFRYPVHFTRGVFDVSNPLLLKTLKPSATKRARALIVLDGNVAQALPTLSAQIEHYCAAHTEKLELVCPPVVVPGGECAKNSWESVKDIMLLTARHHLDRHGYVVAVGGGSVLDMVGFATSIIHRGLRLIRLPTTTLAQNDAGVGVKNSMNACGAKNFVGTFAPPYAVINDFHFLTTLPDSEWRAGIAEAFKVAIIKDRPFFNFLCREADALRLRQAAVMERLVYKTAKLHLQHIATSGDPFELGSARPLDFGHWAAHRLELLSEFRLGHGQAVAIGLAVDSTYAMLKQMITAAELEAILSGLERSGLPVWSELLTLRDPDGTEAVLGGLEQFREHLGGRLCITLPLSIGAKREVHSMNTALIKRALVLLRERSASYGA